MPRRTYYAGACYPRGRGAFFTSRAGTWRGLQRAARRALLGVGIDPDSVPLGFWPLEGHEPGEVPIHPTETNGIMTTVYDWCYIRSYDLDD